MGDYDKALGTLLVGIFFNTYLYGIVTYQFAAYYNTKFNDPLWIKATVLILFITDTFHSASAIYMAWGYTVTNFTNPAILSVALWPYTFTPIGTAIAALLTHNFLGYRIYRLTGNTILYGAIIAVALASFALGVACGTKAWIIREVAKFGVLRPIATWWLSLQTGLDVIITGILTFVLAQARTGFRSTDNVINRLIRGVIQTGVFASIFSLGDLIAFLTSPTTNLYGMFAIPIGRIYTNTLMDTLIMRGGLKEILSGAIEMGHESHSNTIWGKTIVTKRSNLTQSNINLPTINVRKEVFTENNGSHAHSVEGKFEPTQSDSDVFGTKTMV